jgi:hypothetical protein
MKKRLLKIKLYEISNEKTDLTEIIYLGVQHKRALLAALESIMNIRGSISKEMVMMMSSRRR